MAANPNNPVRPGVYQGVCDVCGAVCVEWSTDPQGPAPDAEMVYDRVGRSPQRCQDHPLDPEPPPEPVPAFITPAQLRIAARRVLGIDRATLEGTVASIIAGIEDPAARADAQDKWDLATVIERGHPLIGVVQKAFGKTDAEVDEMFRVGASL